MVIRTFRPTVQGLEEHLIAFNEIIREIDPSILIMDPITSFIDVGSPMEVEAMLSRVLDLFKSQRMLVSMTALPSGSESSEETDVSVSYLVDTWVSLDYVIHGQDRKWTIYVDKSRGRDHSHEKVQFMILSQGVSVQLFQMR